jgi:hypothetical protein
MSNHRTGRKILVVVGPAAGRWRQVTVEPADGGKFERGRKRGGAGPNTNESTVQRKVEKQTKEESSSSNTKQRQRERAHTLYNE